MNVNKKKGGDKKARKPPIRTPTAYLLFSREHREEVRQSIPYLASTDVSSLLSQMWKSLDSSAKDKYKQYAAALAREKNKIEEINSSESNQAHIFPQTKETKTHFPLLNPERETFLPIVLNHIFNPQMYSDPLQSI